MKLLLILFIFALSNIEGKVFIKNLVEAPIVNEGITEKEINQIIDQEFPIDKDTIYSFTISNENYLYSFTSEAENIFYAQLDENYEIVPNGTFFRKGEVVYVNWETSLKESTTIKISPIPFYKELNSLETIKEDKYFFIETEKESILYFDSFDGNSSIYISENFEKEIFKNDTKITGQFYPIEQNTRYLIKTRIYSNCSVSNLKKYFYPLDFDEINIKNDEQNFLYLQKDNSYTLDFTGNTMNKMLKLSSKTLNSTIKINNKDDLALSKDSPYYKLENGFEGQLILEVQDNNAFIELLSNTGEPDIIEELSIKEHKLEKDNVIIKIPKTQKFFVLDIQSDSNLVFSYALGLSQEKEYYYSSSSNDKIDVINNEILLYYLPYKNLEVFENEFVSLALNFERQENQEINISYYQFSLIDEILDDEISEEQCKDIISNLTDVLEIYIYSDIAQNPPNIDGYPDYHHRKINMKEELENVSTTNRKYYEFFQDVQRILTTTKDLHFSIEAYFTSSGYQIYFYMTYLPFDFEIKEDNGTQKIYIKKNLFFDNFDEDIKQFVESHLDIPLKKVNDIDVFDYIQNWSKFSSCKNYHSQFMYIINVISRIYLSQFPLNFTDLINDYEFEDNQIKKISYLISKPKLNLQKSGDVDEFNDEEFNKYFLNIMQKYKFLIKPPIDEIKENYLVEKGLKQKLKIFKEDKIEWNITLEEDVYKFKFKCRVDEKNKVNVIVQNSFYMNPRKLPGAILECIDLFYSNDYPIIAIETLNGGGYGFIPLLQHQMMQMRSTNRAYISYGLNEKTKEYLKLFDFDGINQETCKKITSLEDFEEITDYYDYNGLNISHKRTNTIDEVPLSMRKAMNNYREQYKNSTYLKKPTDIIIFTDAYSYSATSLLIKSFQNTGTGIIVGYYGNPTIKGTHLFDGSQASSSVTDLSRINTSENLLNLGIILGGVTYIESYDISKFPKNNPIPEEYQIYPVDERVEIYSPYSDEIYDKFIEEGLRIHNKYNNENECNPNNEKLLLHDEKCNTFSESGLENAHGGYKCNKDGIWDDGNCFPYYCDIGYFYDREQNKCVEECSFEGNSFLLYKNDYYKEITVERDESYVFWTMNREEFYYVFEASKDVISNYPRICFIDDIDEIYINKDKNSSEPIKLRIKSLTTENSYAHFDSTTYLDLKTVYDIRQVILMKPKVDHVFYASGLYDMPNKNLKIAILDDKLTYENIENSKYNDVNEYSGNFYYFNKDKSYIIDFDYKNAIDQLQLYMNPIEIDENITIIENKTNYLYLQKNKKYRLIFNDNSINRAIKLSRKTLNSVILIKDNNIKLNSDNLYYKLDNNYKGELNIEVNNEDAFIEFIYNLTNVEILNFEDLEFNLKKPFNLITIPKKYNSHKINFELIGNNSKYSIYNGYSIDNYNYYRVNSLKDQIKLRNLSFTIYNPYNNKIKLMKDEYYNVLIRKIEGDLTVKINIEKIDDGSSDSEDKKEEQKGLASWAIALIVVGGVLLLIIIVLIIILCKGKKEQVSNKDIEQKFEGLREIEANE